MILLAAEVELNFLNNIIYYTSDTLFVLGKLSTAVL